MSGLKDILLITNYWHFELEKASSRYLTLANMIVEAGMKLEVVTSSFYHATKCQREYTEEYLSSFPYKITLVKESGYSKNVSLKRLLSQKEFGRNVMKYLRKRKKPDLIYCVVPSLEVSDLVTKYANMHKIKVVLDVQDLWPEAFRMVFSLPIISNLLCYPMRRKANRIYSRANEIIAVSQSYVDRAMKYNHRCIGHCVYLGLELEKFDLYASRASDRKKRDEMIWIVYIGTLGISYNLRHVIDALVYIQNMGYRNVKFVVVGDGPKRHEFEMYAKKQEITYEFTGKLAYSDMVKRLCNADIAVNPIVKNSAASIINKHADYVAAGLPIVNTQESLEFRALLEAYHAGFNCDNRNVEELADKLLQLINDRELRASMGKNSRMLAEEKFNRFKTYGRIIDLLKEE